MPRCERESARQAWPLPGARARSIPLPVTSAGGVQRVVIFNRMVEDSALDTVYGALADGSRRTIVWRLAAEGELTVSDLARPFDMSLNAVSKHIKVLEQAGLVQRRVAGRDHWLSLRSEPLAAAHTWIGLYQRFWESRIDSLERYLGDRKPDVH